MERRGFPFLLEGLVTEKTGLVKFRVTAPAMDGEKLVYPEAYLTPVQVERMAFQPDMILATAHLVRDDFIHRGYGGVEVRADALVTFNGSTGSTPGRSRHRSCRRKGGHNSEGMDIEQTCP